MQQRRLRLGDILDDYCPRERRITNHVVVAMIEDDVKQTRCTTCEAEHEYKQAKLPTLRRKKDPVATAYKEVLAGVTSDAAAVQAAQAASPAPTANGANGANGESPERTEPIVGAPPRAAEELPPTVRAAPEAAAEAPADGDPANGDAVEGDEQSDTTGRVHRRLIRATLPRPENQPAQRPIPQFTMRQPQGRPGKFRAPGSRGPAAARAGQRPGGHQNAAPRGAGFRAGAGRAQGPRNDFHRPPRGGQPARQGKKHSK